MSCKKLTPVRLEVCPPGIDCEGQKILDAYGIQGQYRPLGDCDWIETPVVLHPKHCIDLMVDSDGEYEFQWRSIRHGVKWSGGDAVYSTVVGPWSESTIFSAAVAPPIQGPPAKIILAPGTVC